MSVCHPRVFMDGVRICSTSTRVTVMRATQVLTVTWVRRVHAYNGKCMVLHYHMITWGLIHVIGHLNDLLAQQPVYSC